MADLKLISSEDSPNQEVLNVLADISARVRKSKEKVTFSLIIQEGPVSFNVYGFNLQSTFELIGFLDSAKTILHAGVLNGNGNPPNRP